MKNDFGLIRRSYPNESPSDLNKTQWSRFTAHLNRMNTEAPPNTEYKLLFLSRHGQGYHNVAETKYGRKAWNCYYSLLDGDGEITWSDAHLTPLGVGQAQTLAKYWRGRIVEQKMPVPGLFVSSPLTRAMRTVQIITQAMEDEQLVDGGIGNVGDEIEGVRPKVHVVENLRECIGIHTCDRRSRRSEIEKMFPPPVFEVEDSMTDDDELWVPDLRESDSAMTVRLRGLLDKAMRMPEAKNVQVMSLTAHGGAIMAILRVIGHREFGVSVGGCIPVLVRVERGEGKRPKDVIEPWLPKDDCGDLHEPVDSSSQVAN